MPLKSSTIRCYCCGDYFARVLPLLGRCGSEPVFCSFTCVAETVMKTVFDQDLSFCILCDRWHKFEVSCRKQEIPQESGDRDNENYDQVEQGIVSVEKRSKKGKKKA